MGHPINTGSWYQHLIRSTGGGKGYPPVQNFYVYSDTLDLSHVLSAEHLELDFQMTLAVETLERIFGLSLSVENLEPCGNIVLGVQNIVPYDRIVLSVENT